MSLDTRGRQNSNPSSPGLGGTIRSVLPQGSRPAFYTPFASYTARPRAGGRLGATIHFAFDGGLLLQDALPLLTVQEPCTVFDAFVVPAARIEYVVLGAAEKPTIIG